VLWGDRTNECLASIFALLMKGAQAELSERGSVEEVE